MPIVVYLFKGGRKIRRAKYRQEVLGEEYLSLRYWTVGVATLAAPGYVGRGGALGGAFGALMKGGEWSRVRQKAECWKAILQSGDEVETKLVAWECVKEYLKLDEAQEERVERLLREEGYMETRAVERTWIDEIRDEGRAEGREEGRIEGMQAMLLKLLGVKFGTLSSEVESRVRKVEDPSELARLSERVLEAGSVSEVLGPG